MRWLSDEKTTSSKYLQMIINPSHQSLALKGLYESPVETQLFECGECVVLVYSFSVSVLSSRDAFVTGITRILSQSLNGEDTYNPLYIAKQCLRYEIITVIYISMYILATQKKQTNILS